MTVRISAVVVAAALMAAPGARVWAAGPTVDLPPDAAASERGDDGDEPPADDASAGSSTDIGGYMQLDSHLLIPRHGENKNTIDLSRLVLMVGHNFTNWIRFYTEIEVEHAIASHKAEHPGELEIEQAYLDFKLLGDKLIARAGVVLVPMGLINEYHEPPIFNGVSRPKVDKLIIPSTWREAAIGIHGRPTGWLHYALYGMTGFDPGDFSTSEGVRKGRQQIAKAKALGFALVGRLEVEPVLGLVVGASGYYGLAGPNADPLYDADGARLHLDVPVTGVDVDVRWLWRGFEVRGELAAFFIGDTAKLRQARYSADAAEAEGPDAPSQILGGYLELAYDVFHPLGWDHKLAAFVRGEHYDTAFGLSGRARAPGDRKVAVTDWVMGLTYRPIPQVALKAAVILRRPDDSAANATLIDFGIGAMY